MKNTLLKKLPLFCMLALLCMCILFSGCASRRNVTTEDFSAACDSVGVTLSDYTDQFDPAFIETALLFEDSANSTAIGYYAFVSASEARTYYAQYFSNLYAGTKEEKFIDSTEYNRYYVSNSNATALLYRNGTTMIHIISRDSETALKLIETLGL